MTYPRFPDSDHPVDAIAQAITESLAVLNVLVRGATDQEFDTDAHRCINIVIQHLTAADAARADLVRGYDITKNAEVQA